MPKFLVILPLVLFAGLLALFAGNLGKSPQAVVRSQMVGKPAPTFALEGAGGRAGLATADLAGGRPVLVNLFASWCLPCAVEAPHLETLAEKGVTIYGIAVRDKDADMERFLLRHGNPYQRIGADRGGLAMLGFGASGVPETYVIDGRGIIRHQHLGEIRAEHVGELLSALDKAARP